MARFLIFVLVAASLISLAFAASGKATFYTEYIPSACYGNTDEGTMIAAANKHMYNNGAVCGTKYKVRCTGPIGRGPNPCHGGDVEVTMVDLCDGCKDDQIDLSEDAFSQIADTDAGIIKIKYHKV